MTAQGLSEVYKDVEAAQDYLTDALLVSAYDLHHQLLPAVEQLLDGAHWSTIYAVPQLLVVDSGGYELSSGWDANEVYRRQASPRPFSRDDYDAVVARLPTDLDLLVVTYDYVGPAHGHPDYATQVADARAFIGRHPTVMIDVLLKPPATDAFVLPSRVAPYAPQLRGVHVVGVTEKELGDSIIDRMVAVAHFRRVLDNHGVESPLHVFGALSPLQVGLLFMAGAELFDGLDWLRYGHHAGLAIQRETAALLRGLIDKPLHVRQAFVTIDYLTSLRLLASRLRRWADTGGDFSVMGEHAHVYETAYATMNQRLEEM